MGVSILFNLVLEYCSVDVEICVRFVFDWVMIGSVEILDSVIIIDKVMFFIYFF